ncbi:hypothetical protein ACFQH6_17430 [Halobacteriaceae archaeon GCM10025711]
MTPAFRYEYDVEFDVPGERRDEYDAWLPEATLSWGLDERVAAFGQQRNDTGLDPGVRFIFEFDSLRDWASFVEGDVHQTNVACLQELAKNLRATLWHPQRLAASCTGHDRTSRDDRLEPVEQYG